MCGQKKINREGCRLTVDVGFSNAQAYIYKIYWIIFFSDGAYINDIYYNIFKSSCHLLYTGKKIFFMVKVN